MIPILLLLNYSFTNKRIITKSIGSDDFSRNGQASQSLRGAFSLLLKVVTQLSQNDVIRPTFESIALTDRHKHFSGGPSEHLKTR